MSFAESKILVTGAAGFIGRSVVGALVRQGQMPICLDAHMHDTDNLQHLTVDLTAQSTVPDLPEEIETVFHFAGQIWGNEQAEIQILDNLLEAVKRRGVKRFVYASTCAVYGRQSMDRPVNEDCSLEVLSPYAQGKRLGEERLRLFAERCDVDVAVLRYFNPYGPGQFVKMAVPNMVARAKAGEPIDIYGDGQQIRDFIYIDDLATATIRASAAVEGYRILNVGSGHGTSILELARNIVKICGSQSVIRHLEVPQERQNLEVSYRVADISRLHDLCGWSAQTSLVDGLGRLCRAG